jgi:hypothetical protein
MIMTLTPFYIPKTYVSIILWLNFIKLLDSINKNYKCKIELNLTINLVNIILPPKKLSC